MKIKRFFAAMIKHLYITLRLLIFVEKGLSTKISTHTHTLKKKRRGKARQTE